MISVPPTVRFQDATGWQITLMFTRPEVATAGFDFQRQATVPLAVSMTIPNRPETVIVEVGYEGGEPLALGVHVHNPRSTSISARELRRLPYGRCITAALAAARWVRDHGLNTQPEALAAAQTIPPPYPPSDESRKSPKWYLDLLERHNSNQALGIDSVSEIANKYEVTRNAVYQWLHRGRKLRSLRSAAPKQEPTEVTADYDAPASTQ